MTMEKMRKENLRYLSQKRCCACKQPFPLEMNDDSGLNV